MEINQSHLIFFEKHKIGDGVGKLVLASPSLLEQKKLLKYFRSALHFNSSTIRLHPLRFSYSHNK